MIQPRSIVIITDTWFQDRPKSFKVPPKKRYAEIGEEAVLSVRHRVSQGGEEEAMFYGP